VLLRTMKLTLGLNQRLRESSYSAEDVRGCHPIIMTAVMALMMMKLTM